MFQKSMDPISLRKYFYNLSTWLYETNQQSFLTQQHPDAKLGPSGGVHADHQVHIEKDAEGWDEGDQGDL